MRPTRGTRSRFSPNWNVRPNTFTPTGLPGWVCGTRGRRVTPRRRCWGHSRNIRSSPSPPSSKPTSPTRCRGTVESSSSGTWTVSILRRRTPPSSPKLPVRRNSNRSSARQRARRWFACTTGLGESLSKNCSQLAGRRRTEPVSPRVRNSNSGSTVAIGRCATTSARRLICFPSPVRVSSCSRVVQGKPSWGSGRWSRPKHQR